MIRLPRFRYLGPTSLPEALRILADAGPEAAVLAGGTDLLPNMKRRQQTPATVVGLRGVAPLRERSGAPARGLTVGAMTRLVDLERDAALRAAWPALPWAASLVATPPLRNAATLGGNLCLDTRCSYYDQSESWRRAIGFCLKKDGETCWVAPGSPRCWAVSSSDTAPVLCAIGAEATLASPAGERRVPVASLYADDGSRHLTLARGELLTALHLPPARSGDRAVYLKVRRRASFDFPVLGIAVAARLGAGGVVESARVFLGGVGSRPQEVGEAAAFLAGRALSDGEVVEEAARLVAKAAKPMQNADLTSGWRKRVAGEYAARALRELASGRSAPDAGPAPARSPA
jgi:4-hydroxybenzoyl-CoA reductase subunit beta